jgi:predicted aspartyl protease
MKRQYSDEYFPSIPVLPVRFGNPEDGRFSPSVTAILDTGADATIVPLDLIRQIEPAIGDLHNLRSQWGERRPVRSYLVDVEVDGVNLPGLWVIGDDATDEVLLGRDVLNRLRILLDGLNQQVEIVGY